MYNLKNILLNCLCLVSLFSCNHKPDKPEIKEKAIFFVGTYQGTLPCASCSGIKTIITLNEDKTFNRSLEYLSDENNLYHDKGTFHINFHDSVITLLDKNQENQMYKWSEDALKHLDIEGKEIFGQLRNHYILKRIASKKILK